MINRQAFDSQVSAIMQKHGAFFAFGQKQFNEKAQPDTQYVSCGGGLLAPEPTAATLLDEIETAGKAFAESTLTELGAEKIILHELANHETQITQDISDTVDAVSIYGITHDQVAALFPRFMNHCVENDLF